MFGVCNELVGPLDNKLRGQVRQQDNISYNHKRVMVNMAQQGGTDTDLCDPFWYNEYVCAYPNLQSNILK